MVIGIMGAFGNMKATSSNLPRRRQFSARETLGMCPWVAFGGGSIGGYVPTRANVGESGGSWSGS
jgi:hypothetical protein